MHLPDADHGSGRSLVHDGRQSWRRPTTAGSGDPSPRSGSSAEPSPPTGPPAASASSRAVGGRRRRRGRRQRPSRRAARRRRAAAVCSPSTARWASASSPAPTRPAAAAWPGRWSPRRVLLRLRALTTRELRALSALNDSKQHDHEAREALYPLVLAAAARVVVVSRCVRGIDARGLHVTNLAALRDALRGVGAAGLPLPDRRLRGARLRLRAAADRRRRRDQRGDRRRIDRRQGHPRPLHAPGRRAPPGLGVRRPCRLLDARAPRGDRPPGRLAAAPDVVPVDGLPAARAL